MSQQPKPQSLPQGEQVPPAEPVEPAEGEEAPPAQPQNPPEQPKDEMSPQEKESYDKMMNTISKMNSKIQRVKERLGVEELNTKKNKTNQISDKLINAKQNSEIITKQNLLSDITDNYEKVVIGVYSENGKLKKKIEEMAVIIKDQNGKIYHHAQKQQALVKENQELRAQLLRVKDQRLVQGRGQPTHVHNERTQELSSSKKKAGTQQSAAQNNQDFDFWSMPQNDYGKKKKDFVQDSNLWVNQKQTHESPFVTESNSTSNKRRR